MVFLILDVLLWCVVFFPVWMKKGRPWNCCQTPMWNWLPTGRLPGPLQLSSSPPAKSTSICILLMSRYTVFLCGDFICSFTKAASAFDPFSYCFNYTRWLSDQKMALIMQRSWMLKRTVKALEFLSTVTGIVMRHTPEWIAYFWSWIHGSCVSSPKESILDVWTICVSFHQIIGEFFSLYHFKVRLSQTIAVIVCLCGCTISCLGENCHCWPTKVVPEWCKQPGADPVKTKAKQIGLLALGPLIQPFLGILSPEAFMESGVPGPRPPELPELQAPQASIAPATDSSPVVSPTALSTKTGLVDISRSGSERFRLCASGHER